MGASPQLSPDGAYWWDGRAWQPVAQPVTPPTAPEPSALAPPPPGLAPPAIDPNRPGWLASGVEMPVAQPQSFAPVEPVAGYAGFTPAWAQPAAGTDPAAARGLSWPIAFSLSGGLSQLGVVGAIVLCLMVLNTWIALSEPIGTGRYVLPLSTILVCVRRALKGRWLAVFILGGTWLVCVGLIQARGGP